MSALISPPGFAGGDTGRWGGKTTPQLQFYKSPSSFLADQQRICPPVSRLFLISHQSGSPCFLILRGLRCIMTNHRSTVACPGAISVRSGLRNICVLISGLLADVSAPPAFVIFPQARTFDKVAQISRCG